MKISALSLNERLHHAHEHGAFNMQSLLCALPNSSAPTWLRDSPTPAAAQPRPGRNSERASMNGAVLRALGDLNTETPFEVAIDFREYFHQCPIANHHSIAPEMHGLGRSRACVDYDGAGAAPIAEQLAKLSDAELAVDSHPSFEYNGDDYLQHVRPTIVRFVQATGGRARESQVRAVRAVLTRDMVYGTTDCDAYTALGVPQSNYFKWKGLVNALRAQAPAHADAADALVTLSGATPPTSPPASAPPSPPSASADDDSALLEDSLGCVPALCNPQPPVLPPAAFGFFVLGDGSIQCCKCTSIFVCSGVRQCLLDDQPGTVLHVPTDPTGIHIIDGAKAATLQRDPSPAASAAPPLPAPPPPPPSSVGVSSTDRPGIAPPDFPTDGLALPCAAFDDFSPDGTPLGKGLRFIGDEACRGTFVGAFIGSELVTVSEHTKACRRNPLYGEYANELRGWVLRSGPRPIGVALVNEDALPNIELILVEIDRYEQPAATLACYFATCRLRQGDPLYADYGEAYDDVRKAKNYLRPACQGDADLPPSLQLSDSELEQAVRQAFPGDALEHVIKWGGVLDYDSDKGVQPGKRGDPNRRRVAIPRSVARQLAAAQLPAHGHTAAQLAQLATHGPLSDTRQDARRQLAAYRLASETIAEAGAGGEALAAVETLCASFDDASSKQPASAWPRTTVHAAVVYTNSNSAFASDEAARVYFGVQDAALWAIWLDRLRALHLVEQPAARKADTATTSSPGGGEATTPASSPPDAALSPLQQVEAWLALRDSDDAVARQQLAAFRHAVAAVDSTGLSDRALPAVEVLCASFPDSPTKQPALAWACAAAHAALIHLSGAGPPFEDDENARTHYGIDDAPAWARWLARLRKLGSDAGADSRAPTRRIPPSYHGVPASAQWCPGPLSATSVRETVARAATEGKPYSPEEQRLLEEWALREESAAPDVPLPDDSPPCAAAQESTPAAARLLTPTAESSIIASSSAKPDGPFLLGRRPRGALLLSKASKRPPAQPAPVPTLDADEVAALDALLQDAWPSPAKEALQPLPPPPSSPGALLLPDGPPPPSPPCSPPPPLSWLIDGTVVHYPTEEQLRSLNTGDRAILLPGPPKTDCFGHRWDANPLADVDYGTPEVCPEMYGLGRSGACVDYDGPGSPEHDIARQLRRFNNQRDLSEEVAMAAHAQVDAAEIASAFLQQMSNSPGDSDLSATVREIRHVNAQRDLAAEVAMVAGDEPAAPDRTIVAACRRDTAAPTDRLTVASAEPALGSPDFNNSGLRAARCPCCWSLLSITHTDGCSCGGGVCSVCLNDSCACPWLDGKPAPPPPLRAAANAPAFGYVDLPLGDPYAPSIIIVGEFSGAFAKACRERFPSEITLTVDFRLAEHGFGLHYCGDVRDVLWRHRWRLLIGHPPCAKAARSNTVGLAERLADGSLWFAMSFAVMLYTAPADTVIVEQPPSWLETVYRPPDRRLQFLDFGVPYSKEWLLWTRGGDFLSPTPSTPGASPSAAAAHRIQHSNKDERERLRSTSPPQVAEAVCSAITLGAAPPAPQPIMSEELAAMARGYRAAFATEPPPGWDSPIAMPPRGGASDYSPNCRRRRAGGADPAADLPLDGRRRPAGGATAEPAAQPASRAAPATTEGGTNAPYR